MDVQRFVNARMAEREARGLVVEATFEADAVGVRRNGCAVGTTRCGFATEEARDDFVRRVRTNGGTAVVL